MHTINPRIIYGLVALAAFSGILFVLLPAIFPKPLGGYADQRLLLVLYSGFLVLIMTPTLVIRAKGWNFLSALLPVTLLVAIFVVLASFSSESAYSWVEVGLYSFFFVAVVFSGKALVGSDGRSKARFSGFMVYLAAGSCFAYGAMTINVYLFAISDGVTNLVNYIPWGFVSIRYWSHIATWFLPLAPLAVLVGPWQNSLLWQILVALGAGLWWWIIFLSTSRGSALGIAFGVVFVGFLLGRRVWPWLKMSLLYLGLGGIFWLMLSVAIPSLIADEVQLRSLKTDSSGRWPLFVEAWYMSLQNFPLGMGPQSWLTHEPITEAYGNGKKFGHPHNMYLMWAAEYGWLLIAALGVVVIQAIRNFWRRRAQLFEAEDSGQLLLLAGFTASVSAALFHAGVSAVFMAPGSMLVGMFVLIAFWALIQPTPVVPGSRPQPSSISKPRMVIAVLVATAILLVWALWANQVWQYYKDMRADEPYYYDHESEGRLPRFWFHGNFPREVSR